MTAIIISFLLGTAFGVMTACLIAAGREDEYLENGYSDTRIASKQEERCEMCDCIGIDIPELEFCPECEEKVRNNRTDICTECRQKKQEYEKAYHCTVDLGINGPPGCLGEERIFREGHE